MRAKISNNLLCCLCLASLVIVCNLFPTLGYCEPFFSIFSGSFFFFLDPARCWLNSCLQPWCWNITENYIIMLKLVNKERQTTSLNHGAQDSMRITKFTTSDAANSYILSPAAQVNWLANDNCFTPQSEFKVSTWPLCGILNSIFFSIINQARVETWVTRLRQLRTSDDLFPRHLLIRYLHLRCYCCDTSLKAVFSRKLWFISDLKWTRWRR